MKKVLMFAVLVMTFCFPVSSHGADAAGRGLYVGIGGSYNLEDLDVHQFNVTLEDTTSDLDVDFDDTWGVNAKVGYHVHDWLSLEFNFDWLSGFESDKTDRGLGVPVDAKVELEVMTYMAVAKFSHGFGWEGAKLFIVAGGGLMDADADGKVHVAGGSDSVSDSETDSCARLGVGVDFFATKRISIGFEGSYVWGFGDLDEIQYFSLTAGLGYHF